MRTVVVLFQICEAPKHPYNLLSNKIKIIFYQPIRPSNYISNVTKGHIETIDPEKENNPIIEDHFMQMINLNMLGDNPDKPDTPSLAFSIYFRRKDILIYYIPINKFSSKFHLKVSSFSNRRAKYMIYNIINYRPHSIKVGDRHVILADKNNMFSLNDVIWDVNISYERVPISKWKKNAIDLGRYEVYIMIEDKWILYRIIYL